MKLKFLSLLILITSISAAACSPRANEQPILDQSARSDEVTSGETIAEIAPSWDQTTQVNEQGAVVVEATPLNLNTQGDTLEFEISLNTHSVDLSMDLAQLATLATDSGLSVNAMKWDAPSGGHHVSGKLIFPSMLEEGEFILDGANNITIQIRDVDVSLREFVWQVQ